MVENSKIDFYSVASSSRGPCALAQHKGRSDQSEADQYTLLNLKLRTAVSFLLVGDDVVTFLPPPLPAAVIPPRTVRTLPTPDFIFSNPLSVSERYFKLSAKFSVIDSAAS